MDAAAEPGGLAAGRYNFRIQVVWCELSACVLRVVWGLPTAVYEVGKWEYAPVVV